MGNCPAVTVAIHMGNRLVWIHSQPTCDISAVKHSAMQHESVTFQSPLTVLRDRKVLVVPHAVLVPGKRRVDQDSQ